MSKQRKTPPYGQYYDCLAQLIKPGVTYKLLLYLLRRYMIMYRQDQVGPIQIKYQTIARKIGVDRRAIDGALNELSKVKFISRNKKTECSVNIKIILGAVYAFEDIDKKDTEAQNEFVKTLNDGDYEGLKKFGFELYDEGCLDELSGSPMTDDMYMDVQLTENVHPCTDNKSVHECTDNKSVHECTFSEKVYMNVHFDHEIIDEMYIHVHNLLQSDYEPNDFKSALDDFFGENLTENRKIKLINSVFGDNSQQPKDELPELLVFGYFYLLKKCTSMYSGVYMNVHFDSKKCTSMYTRYKYIYKIKNIREEKNKNKKENFENDGVDDDKTPSRENKRNDRGTSRRSRNVDEDWDNDLEEQTPSFKKENDFGDSLEPDSDNQTSSPEEKNYWQPSASYYISKKKANLPYFRSETVQEFGKDITKCADRFDKLFIHYLIEIAHELYDRDEETDGDGLVVVEASNNLVGVPIPVDRTYTDLVGPALQATEDTIRVGYVELDGKRVDVTASFDDKDQVDLIIDWEIQNLCSGQHYIFSYDRFKNPNADELPVIKTKRRRGDTEGREDDYLYMQKILLMNQIDDRWESLTPLEGSVCNFLGRFFQFNDNFEIIGTIVEQDPITNKDIEKVEATKNELDLVRLYDLSAPVTFEDLIGCTLVGKTDKYGWMKIMNRMFSAEKIRYWNSMHGYTSAVDEADVNGLLDEYKNQLEGE